MRKKISIALLFLIITSSAAAAEWDSLDDLAEDPPSQGQNSDSGSGASSLPNQQAQDPAPPQPATDSSSNTGMKESSNEPQLIPDTAAAPPLAVHEPQLQAVDAPLLIRNVSRLTTRIDQFERQIAKMEQDNRFLEQRVRNLDREVEDLKRRRFS